MAQKFPLKLKDTGGSNPNKQFMFEFEPDDFVGVDDGGTGATTAADARTNLDVYSKAESDSVAAAAAGVVQGNLDAHTGDGDIHFSDAPADGNIYGRQDNVWVQNAGGAQELNDLNDVTIASPADNDCLSYSGGGWDNSQMKISLILFGGTVIDIPVIRS